MRLDVRRLGRQRPEPGRAAGLPSWRTMLASTVIAAPAHRLANELNTARLQEFIDAALLERVKKLGKD